MSAMDKQQEQLEALTARLEQGVQELYSSERYTQYLRTMSKFYQYSANNVLLICMQRPDATAVASYTAWKRDFGRQVNRGEHGIQILCPVPRHYETEKRDPKTHQPLLDVNGDPVRERREIIFFKIGYVYDVSQTSGKELPSLVKPLEGTVEEYSNIMAVLREVAPVPIGFEVISGAANGYYHTQEHRIAIREGMSQPQTIKTAVHELAHSLLDAEVVRDAPQPDRRTREVRAESVAFCVCSHLGIDTSEYSFGYVAGWSSGRDVRELTAELELIRKTSGDIIQKIDERLQIRQPERERPPRARHR